MIDMPTCVVLGWRQQRPVRNWRLTGWWRGVRGGLGGWRFTHRRNHGQCCQPQWSSVYCWLSVLVLWSIQLRMSVPLRTLLPRDPCGGQSLALCAASEVILEGHVYGGDMAKSHCEGHPGTLGPITRAMYQVYRSLKRMHSLTCVFLVC